MAIGNPQAGDVQAYQYPLARPGRIEHWRMILNHLENCCQGRRCIPFEMAARSYLNAGNLYSTRKTVS